MSSSLSNEELEAFLDEIGVTSSEPAVAQSDSNSAIEDLLTDVGELVGEKPVAPDEKIVVSEVGKRQSWSTLRVAYILVIFFFLWSSALFFVISQKMDQQITALSDIHKEMASLRSTLETVEPTQQELPEELLLEDLNPPFLENEIIEPIDLLPDFSIA